MQSLKLVLISALKKHFKIEILYKPSKGKNKI